MTVSEKTAPSDASHNMKQTLQLLTSKTQSDYKILNCSCAWAEKTAVRRLADFLDLLVLLGQAKRTSIDMLLHNS